MLAKQVFNVFRKWNFLLDSIIMRDRGWWAEKEMAPRIPKKTKRNLNGDVQQDMVCFTHCDRPAGFARKKFLLMKHSSRQIKITTCIIIKADICEHVGEGFCWAQRCLLNEKLTRELLELSAAFISQFCHDSSGMTSSEKQEALTDLNQLRNTLHVLATVATWERRFHLCAFCVVLPNRSRLSISSWLDFAG